jgi:enoyl-CoA hydratase/carnithine racemase
MAHPALESLLLGIDGDVATLAFNHGKANEMGSAELRDIERICAFLETGEVRSLVSTSRRVSARGTSIFISGANVTERTGWTTSAIKAHVRWQRSVLARLRRAPVFHVAVVDGIALGWGTEFTLTCDYRIAGPNARFGLPETGLGILPGAGGSSELSARIGVNQALRLGMTGEQINADEAVRIGLADERCDSLEAGLARASTLARLVARRSPTSVAAYKSAVLGTVGIPGAEREAVEAAAYEHCVDSGDAAIGREHFAALTAGGVVPWGAFRPWTR